MRLVPMIAAALLLAACADRVSPPPVEADGEASAAASPDAAVPSAAGYEGGIRFVSISAGEQHTCAVASDGTGYCWGQNEAGQLGTGAESEYEPVPVAVAGGLRFRVIDAGDAHTCGLTTEGGAYCWGEGSNGELGTGEMNASSRVPVPVAGGTRFASITVGRFHTCALDHEGTAYCWGSNDAGQLGTGDSMSLAAPTLLAGGLVFAQLSAGSAFTCGVTPEGAGYCWGSNTVGQLGTGAAGHRQVPASITGGLSFAQIIAGGSSACGVTVAGEAHCWGKNDFGQLGSGARSRGLDPNPRPVHVAGGGPFRALSVGGAYACGLAEEGQAYCWGDNRSDSQMLGSAASPDNCSDAPNHVAECSTRPAPVAGGRRFAAISAGAFHTCALTEEGRAFCWGTNWAGGLGTGSELNAVEPAEVRAPG